MTPMRICQSCYGGGFFLLDTPAGPDISPCETCKGEGLVCCPICNDSGWMPEIDMYGEYDCDTPCVCTLGRRLMHAPHDTPGEITEAF